MKLIYVVNARMPTDKAHGHQIATMCNEYAQLGHEVELWVPTRKNPITEDVFEYYDLPRSFTVRYIPTFDFIQFEKMIGRYGGLLQVPSFLVSFLAFLAFKHPKRDVHFLSRNPDIVWVASRLGYSTVYECHDWFRRHTKRSLWFLKKAYGVIATNALIAQEFLDRGFQKEQVHVAPNGVSLERFALSMSKEEALDRLDISDALKNVCRESSVLMYTGSYTTMGVDKGIDLVLEALASLPHTSFIAVGGAEWEVQKYQEVASKLGVTERCHFEGRVSQDDIAIYQQIADILVMPFPKKAHYERHMCPLKMFEYMASGRPIIASRLPSIQQVLKHETNAVLIDPGDAVVFTEVVQSLAKDDYLSKRLAKVALADVSKHTWRQRAVRIVDWWN